MYQDDNNKINWFIIFLRIIIILLTLAITAKLILLLLEYRQVANLEKQVSNNLNKMDDYSSRYLVVKMLPDESGESNIVYLNEISDSLVLDLVNGKSCDLNKSYIKITKLDHEYQTTSYLECDGYADYINTFRSIEEEIENNNTTSTPTTTTTTTTTTLPIITELPSTSTTTTTTTPTTTKTTRKPTTTNSQKFTVSFNSNGGTEVPTQKVKANGIINEPNEPIREGYKFDGWYYHGNEFNFNTKITQDYVLVAKWTKI